MYGLECEYAFDSAHFLTDYYGKCENLHGHRWRVVAKIEQPELQTEGTMKDMVLDFGVFKKTVKEICDGLDHTFLIEEESLKPDTLAALQREGFNLTVLPFPTTALFIASNETAAHRFGEAAFHHSQHASINPQTIVR